jgi:flagellar FliJ protein
MKAFRFPLAPVLEYRRQVEDSVKREFAFARKEVILQKQRISLLETEREEAGDELKRMEIAELNVISIIAQRRYMSSVERRIRKGTDDLARLRTVEEQKRQALIKATKDRKAMEKLRERRHAEYLYQAGREELKFLDEVGARMATVAER